MSNRSTKRPTLKTISALSGLAVPTVSRALNDAPDIGQDTKRRVREIAREIGYVPNRAGLRLKTGKTNVISLVLSTEHDMINHTARFISSIAGAFRQTHYHLIVTPYFPDEDPMIPVQYIVETKSADAVILNQIEPRDPRVAYLMERKFPFATHGRTVWCDQHPYFDYDNAAYSRYAAQRLYDLGRRHLLMIAPPRAQTYAGHFIEGARQVSARSDADLVVLAGASSDSKSDRIRAAVLDALRTNPQTDGIICASTTAAMSAVAAVEETGRVVGRDIDVFAKEAIPFLKLFRPAIHAVMENVSAAGTFLAEAAMQAIDEPDAPPMQGLDVLDAKAEG